MHAYQDSKIKVLSYPPPVTFLAPPLLSKKKKMSACSHVVLSDPVLSDHPT